MATAIQQIDRAATMPPLNPSGIRLEIFNQVPGWAIVHPATDDRTAPLIRAGEVAVIESDGCKGVIPEDGGLYLIEYVTPPHCGRYGRERRTRQIVQTCKSERGGWYAHPFARRLGGRLVPVVTDGPYTDECHMAEQIIGKVVGIYRPKMEALS